MRMVPKETVEEKFTPVKASVILESQEEVDAVVRLGRQLFEDCIDADVIKASDRGFLVTLVETLHAGVE